MQFKARGSGNYASLCRFSVAAVLNQTLNIIVSVICRADGECDMDVVSSPTRRNGTVMSPRYPSVYPANVHCRVTLKPRSDLGERVDIVTTSIYPANVHCRVTLRPRSDLGERVQLVFIDFDLNYPIGNPRDPHEYVGRILLL